MGNNKEKSLDTISLFYVQSSDYFSTFLLLKTRVELHKTISMGVWTPVSWISKSFKVSKKQQEKEKEFRTHHFITKMHVMQPIFVELLNNINTFTITDGKCVKYRLGSEL